MDIFGPAYNWNENESAKGSNKIHTIPCNNPLKSLEAKKRLNRKISFNFMHR